MMRPQPMIALANVLEGSEWFQKVLGLRSAHGGDEYEMLMDGNELALQLHHWDSHDHPHLGSQDDGSRGNGVLLWFATDDLSALLSRVAAEGVEVLDGPLFNASAQHREIWLRGPEGYRVVVAGS